MRQLDKGTTPAHPSRFAQQAAAGGPGVPFASGVFAEEARAGNAAEPGHLRGLDAGRYPGQNPDPQQPRAVPERRRRLSGLVGDAGDDSDGEDDGAEACGDDVHDPGAITDSGRDPDSNLGPELRTGGSRSGGGADVAGNGSGQWDAHGHLRFGQGRAGLGGAGRGAGGFVAGPRAGAGSAGLAGRLDEFGEDSEGGDLGAPPVASRYLAARMQDDDEEAPDGDAIPGTP